MPKYQKDRNFTDYVHRNLTVPLIYNDIRWKEKDIDKDLLERIDMAEGIDYVLIDEFGKIINVQERFRDAFYKNFNDATIRYRRDQNSNPDRIKSEFYKIKADYLVYGITNGKKFIDKRHTLTDFIKWVILDVKFIQQKFKEEKIKITKSSHIKCWIENDALICPENFNSDPSSSFIPFDIKLIYQLWGITPIYAQKGFL
jgi:hypothetical protein